MPSLVIPRSGLPLEVSMKSNLPPNGIIGLTLNDDVIEDMIKCVRSGEAIQLSLGIDTVSAV
jgi:RNA polymerase II elongation factor ELL